MNAFSQMDFHKQLLLCFGLVLVGPVALGLAAVLGSGGHGSLLVSLMALGSSVVVALASVRWLGRSRGGVGVHEADALQESLRIRSALDATTTNVMVADENLNIIYLNRTVRDMMRIAQPDIRKDLPQFDVDRLLGTNIDSFHKDPSHQRRVLGALNTTFESKLSLGGRTFRIIANPVFDDAGKRLGTVVEWADLTESLKREAEEQARAETAAKTAAENARIRQALDSVTSNVMVADQDLNIIYLNNTVKEMMGRAQQDIRKELPHFDVTRLLGTNIDGFHKNPSHQRGLLAALRSTFKSQLSLGGRTFQIIANPVFDDAGERLGTVVEWADRTQEVAVEKEVAGIVKAVVDGELHKRIDLTDKSGFFETLANGINELVGNVAAAVEESQELVESANNGDLAKRMPLEGKAGLYQKIGSGINGLVSNVAVVVDEVQDLVESANNGDLTKRMPLEGRAGLYQKVGSGINQLTSNMSEVVSKVKAAAMEVDRGADEISQGNLNLSQRTEEQASSLEQTASSMDQMTSTVKQTADNAAQANQLAVAARDQAEKGGSVVASAVTAMAEINAASKSIADIIGVIDEIAFQTNLLALNAAVEAARAGEQGRGFAVVATEVRNLAGRSASAAKEIKALIQNSVTKVEEGNALVTESGQTLEQIVGAVKKVTDIVAEIAAASQEQSAGIEQVNKAVMQLDELTQQNAALVEEASAASQSMADQSRALNEMMSRYRVNDDATGAVAAAQLQRPQHERRGPNRPWSKSAAPTAAPAARKPAARVAGGDAEWEEF